MVLTALLRVAALAPRARLASEEETRGNREAEGASAPKPIPPVAGPLRRLLLRRISCLRDQLSISPSFSFSFGAKVAAVDCADEAGASVARVVAGAAEEASEAAETPPPMLALHGLSYPVPVDELARPAPPTPPPAPPSPPGSALTRLALPSLACVCWENSGCGGGEPNSSSYLFIGTGSTRARTLLLLTLPPTPPTPPLPAEPRLPTRTFCALPRPEFPGDDLFLACAEDGFPVLNVDLMLANLFFRCFSAHGDGLPGLFHRFFRCELILWRGAGDQGARGGERWGLGPLSLSLSAIDPTWLRGVFDYGAVGFGCLTQHLPRARSRFVSTRLNRRLHHRPLILLLPALGQSTVETIDTVP